MPMSLILTFDELIANNATRRTSISNESIINLPFKRILIINFKYLNALNSFEGVLYDMTSTAPHQRGLLV
jgi:hypothetical protein